MCPRGLYSINVLFISKGWAKVRILYIHSNNKKKITYRLVLPTQKVLCRAYPAFWSADMFGRKLLARDSLLRQESKVCEVVVCRVVLMLKIWHPVVEGWTVVRMPLEVRWRYKKLAYCIITSCSYWFESFLFAVKIKIKLFNSNLSLLILHSTISDNDILYISYLFPTLLFIPFSIHNWN